MLEPILLGLLIAPSLAGAALAVAAFALFLVNRPLKIFWADTRKGRSYARTAAARRYALIYGVVALVGGVAALALGGWLPFAPFALAGPLFLVFIYFDQRPGRSWQAELIAPVAFAAVVAALALAGGLSWPVALALWGFVVARSAPAVLYVRARLRLDKGKPVSPLWTVLAHVLGLAGVVGLVSGGWLPWTAALAVAILLARAVWGLSPYRWRSSIQALGFLEMGFGLLTVLLVAIGFWLS